LLVALLMTLLVALLAVLLLVMLVLLVLVMLVLLVLVMLVLLLPLCDVSFACVATLRPHTLVCTLATISSLPHRPELQIPTAW
jgi:hypothetical protein